MAVMTAARQRKLERAMHLLTAATVLAYIYLPAERELEDVIRLLVFPLLALSGMAMWQAPRLRRALKAARSRERRHLHVDQPTAGAERERGFATSTSRLERRR
jgi:hypothetical protein